MNAAKKIFGGDGLRIGAAWRSTEVPDYGTLLDKVIELIPNLGGKLKTDTPKGGDAGWDILVVKNFCDNRIHSSLLLEIALLVGLIGREGHGDPAYAFLGFLPE